MLVHFYGEKSLLIRTQKDTVPVISYSYVNVHGCLFHCTMPAKNQQGDATNGKISSE